LSVAETFGELGLRPRETSVIRDCLWARTVVPNGHYLCSPGQIASAKRLIDKGFITNVTSEAGMSPRVRGDGSDGWLVVKIDEANIEAMRKAESVQK